VSGKCKRNNRPCLARFLSMPPSLALAICWVGILWFFYQDNRRRPTCSRALWISVIWFLLLGSHPASYWLSIRIGNGSDLEGNPFDLMVNLGLMVASFYVLMQRRLSWGALLSQNKGMVFFYVFLLITVFWAAYPFVTFKRWIKEVGGILPGLLILTEEDPMEAIEAVFLRCAYVLLPLSVIFIKYVGSLGRRYSPEGGVEYVGVTDQKNDLGLIVMVFSVVILWSLGRRFDFSLKKIWKSDRWSLLVLVMGLWLLHISDSKTALICLVVGAVILTSYKLPILKNYPKLALALFLGALPLAIAMNNVFHITEPILRLIGRDPTFTNRTEIWSVIKDHPVNPIIGTGYLMYWDLHPLILLSGNMVSLKTLHNGYLEIFVDGGILGLIALFIMLIALGFNIGRAYLGGTSYGRLRLAFFLITVLYNLSESVYARRSLLWVSFLMFCLDPDSIYCWRATPLPKEGAEPDLVEEGQTGVPSSAA
jgi:O-antigen ligase